MKQIFKLKRADFVSLAAGLFLLVFFCSGVLAQRGKTPVIVIPGFIGSELINERTNELVWFKTIRSRTDDLRLPLSENLAANRDSLVPRDALRSLKIGLRRREGVYGTLLDAFKTRGYEERAWENPKAADAVYVFAYDWRRDNVENARLLVQKIEAVKRRLRQPDLKFNVVAHSMGGLVARYAAMYGDADLTENSRPTWAGARHFNRLVLVGTPNAGAILALSALAGGFVPFGVNINLPFVQNLTRFDIFSIPAIFQLLPHDGAFRAFDENLKPLDLDIYDARNWDKYGWNPMSAPQFARQFDARDRRNARQYFLAALSRAKQFQNALAANAGSGDSSVKIYLVGAECKETPDSIVIRRDGQTLFKATAFRRTDGKQVSAAELQRVMFAPGDGIVSRRSLTSGKMSDGSAATDLRQCEGHNNLVANSPIQTTIFRRLEN